MMEKRKRGRPPKDPSGRRVAKISTYVSDEVADALRAESDVRGMTISELVATVLEGHVFSDKKDVQLPPVPRDAIYAVIMALADEGLILGANVSPKTIPKTISSAKLSPQTSLPSTTGAKAEEQRDDDSGSNVAPSTKRRGKGGEDT
ncbi:hypothetical protein [Alicyclobacillus ferrooxydans]|uniref:Uncharacterized protein n=1 Tax=Alicyclobacillus ferrooxydans TaxID=471514 RepID=A0A0P9CIK7_9BACL|nr:hypothetical protein [Alicyclobacillus ferrooxydans]KPV45487.1 hypothetical protein AN477_00555 [Alicyclobacillus ferrooxydans]